MKFSQTLDSKIPSVLIAAQTWLQTFNTLCRQVFINGQVERPHRSSMLQHSLLSVAYVQVERSDRSSMLQQSLLSTSNVHVDRLDKYSLRQHSLLRNSKAYVNRPYRSLAFRSTIFLVSAVQNFSTMLRISGRSV